MDIIVAIIGLALAVVVAAYIARPFVARSRTLPSGESPRDQLLAERDALYVAIRDLDFDFQTGKLMEVDYRAVRERYVVRGVEILKELDATDIRPQTVPGRGSATDRGPEAAAVDDIEVAVQARRRAKSPEDEIEAAIRARRQAQTGALPSAVGGRVCPLCGLPVDPSDRFCGKCGTALTVEATR